MSRMHAFDTLAFAKKLKNAGYTETQAEALAEAQGDVFREMLESTLATKDDINGLDGKIAGLRQDFRGDFAGLRQEFKSDVAGLRQEIELMGQRLTIRLGAMLAVAVGALAAMRFFG